MNTKEEFLSHLEYFGRLVKRGILHIDIFNSLIESEIKEFHETMNDIITYDEIENIKNQAI